MAQGVSAHGFSIKVRPSIADPSGRVDGTSTLGDGSTFTLRLPARPPEAPLPLPAAIEIESGAAGR